MAIIFTVLLVFVGLATDTGIIYVSYGQFRRAVDAAALAAASQYRQARSSSQINDDALQFLQLQGFTPTTYAVQDCDAVTQAAIAAGTYVGTYPPTAAYGTVANPNVNPDTAVCTFPVRKLVRVVATTDIHLVFTPMFHVFGEVLPITASAVAEAASLEIMLVIDVSPSMAYDNGVVSGTDYSDASTCNTTAAALSPYYPGQLPAQYTSGGVVYSPIHSCRPFEYVRDAAVQFVDQFVKFPFDRVGIVTFCNSAVTNQSIGDAGASDSKTVTLTTLRGLDVCTPTSTPPSYVSGVNGCDINSLTFDLGKCMATDTGDGIEAARIDLSAYSRPTALRFVILLSDGSANGSSPTAGTSGGTPHYACPKNVNKVVGDSNYDDFAFNYKREFCQDGDSRNESRHLRTDGLYDADDYARDKADLLGSMQNMIVFTIGLGNAVTYNPLDADSCPTDNHVGYGYFPVNPSNPNELGYGTTGQPLCNADSLPAGEQLLRYIADAGDGDGINAAQTNPPCARDTHGNYQATIGTSCGNYYFAATGTQLQSMFIQIAQHIFTRITQ